MKPSPTGRVLTQATIDNLIRVDESTGPSPSLEEWLLALKADEPTFVASFGDAALVHWEVAMYRAGLSTLEIVAAFSLEDLTAIIMHEDGAQELHRLAQRDHQAGLSIETARRYGPRWARWARKDLARRLRAAMPYMVGAGGVSRAT